MTSLSIVCGANSGHCPEYKTTALTFGEAMVESDITLVYGRGNVGLMGCIANHALSLGGQIIGVIPHRLLGLEVGHTNLSELHTVKTLSGRKQKMCDLADGFRLTRRRWHTRRAV